MELPFQRIAILGVGLIGGSLGMAWRALGRKVQVIGIGRDPERLEIARRLGAVDEIRTDSEENAAALHGCDLVVLATPIEHILSSLEEIGASLDPGTVVTDVGSTKRQICLTAWQHLPPQVEFIGGHPIAGREVGGVENGSAALFENAAYVLCSRAGADSPNLRKMIDAVSALGASPVVMSPEDHDAAMARLSHMPQLLSTALANASEGMPIAISGSGYRDMMRLAGSPYSVWKGILETNGDNVAEALDALIAHLDRMRAVLRGSGNSEELAAAFASAQRLYDSLVR
jgi:prephenate dehydrogenase